MAVEESREDQAPIATDVRTAAEGPPHVELRALLAGVVRERRGARRMHPDRQIALGHASEIGCTPAFQRTPGDVGVDLHPGGARSSMARSISRTAASGLSSDDATNPGSDPGAGRRARPCLVASRASSGLTSGPRRPRWRLARSAPARSLRNGPDPQTRSTSIRPGSRHPSGAPSRRGDLQHPVEYRGHDVGKDVDLHPGDLRRMRISSRGPKGRSR